MKKWKQVGLLTLLMGGCFAAGAVASNGIERVDAFLRPDYKVIVEGKAADLDTPVLIYNNSSYIPVRAVSKLLGADVNWHEQTNSIYINPRFPGQPEAPNEESEYREIILQQPFAYKVTYLGKEYGLLSIVADYNNYYRVEDLARMGIDTRGVTKSRDAYTGYLFIKQEEADKLWKEQPIITVSIEPVMTGVYDKTLESTFLDFAKLGLPMLHKYNPDMYPNNLFIFYIDAVADHPGWYYMFCRDERNELSVIVANYAQNENGTWYQKSMSNVKPDYLHRFFDNKK